MIGYRGIVVSYDLTCVRCSRFFTIQKRWLEAGVQRERLAIYQLPDLRLVGLHLSVCTVHVEYRQETFAAHTIPQPRQNGKFLNY